MIESGIQSWHMKFDKCICFQSEVMKDNLLLLGFTIHNGEYYCFCKILWEKFSRIFTKLGQNILLYELYNSPRYKWPWPIFQGHRVIQRSNFAIAISGSRSARAIRLSLKYVPYNSWLICTKILPVSKRGIQPWGFFVTFCWKLWNAVWEEPLDGLKWKWVQNVPFGCLQCG